MLELANRMQHVEDAIAACEWQLQEKVSVWEESGLQRGFQLWLNLLASNMRHTLHHPRYLTTSVSYLDHNISGMSFTERE